MRSLHRLMLILLAIHLAATSGHSETLGDVSADFNVSNEFSAYLHRLPLGAEIVWQANGRYFTALYGGFDPETSAHQYFRGREISGAEYQTAVAAGVPSASAGSAGSGGSGSGHSPEPGASTGPGTQGGNSPSGGSNGGPSDTPGGLFRGMGGAALGAGLAAIGQGAFRAGMNGALGRAQEGLRQANNANRQSVRQFQGAVQQSAQDLIDTQRETTRIVQGLNRSRENDERSVFAPLTPANPEGWQDDFAGFTSTDPRFRQRADSIWQRLREAQPQNIEQSNFKAAGIRTLEAADNAWVASDYEVGEFLLGLGNLLTDIAVGGIPLTSMADDSVVIMSGHNYRGVEANPLEMGIAFVNLSLTIWTAGISAPPMSVLRRSGRIFQYFKQAIRLRAELAGLHAAELVRIFTRSRMNLQQISESLIVMNRAGLKLLAGIPGARRLASGEWISQAGAIYKSEEFIASLARHMENGGQNSIDLARLVISTPLSDIGSLIDEAWGKRGPGQPYGAYWVYEVPMGRVIGPNGETTLRIVTEGRDSSKLVTIGPAR